MTVAQMRAALGLADTVPDAEVVAAYAAYLAAGGDEPLDPPVGLADVKRHLRLEPDYTDEDEYLNIFIPAALRSIENATGRDMRTAASTLTEDDRTVIGQAMLLLIGHWYANREAVIVGAAPAELPMAVQWLIGPFRVWHV